MSLIRIKSLINAFFVFPSLLNGAVFSTVSPYIQTAAAQINAEVVQGMGTVTSKVMAIKGRAEAGFKPQYEKKEKMLGNIKQLQADSLLQLQEIQTETFAGSKLRSIESKISGNSAQTDLIATEKTAGITNTELSQ